MATSRICSASRVDHRVYPPAYSFKECQCVSQTWPELALSQPQRAQDDDDGICQRIENNHCELVDEALGHWQDVCYHMAEG